MRKDCVNVHNHLLDVIQIQGIYISLFRKPFPGSRAGEEERAWEWGYASVRILPTGIYGPHKSPISLLLSHQIIVVCSIYYLCMNCNTDMTHCMTCIHTILIAFMCPVTMNSLKVRIILPSPLEYLSWKNWVHTLFDFPADLSTALRLQFQYTVHV